MLVLVGEEILPDAIPEAETAFLHIGEISGGEGVVLLDLLFGNPCCAGIDFRVLIGRKPHIGVAPDGISHTLGGLRRPGTRHGVELEILVVDTLGAFIYNHSPDFVPGVLTLSTLAVLYLVEIDRNLPEEQSEAAVAERPDHTSLTDVLIVHLVADDIPSKMGYRLVAGVDGCVHTLPLGGILQTGSHLGGFLQKRVGIVKDARIAHTLNLDTVDTGLPVSSSDGTETAGIAVQRIHKTVYPGL